MFTCFDCDFQGYTPTIWRTKRKRHKIINMQKLWRRDYNFNVNKDQLPLARFYKHSLWNGDFLSFKSTNNDIIEFHVVYTPKETRLLRTPDSKGLLGFG